MPHLGIRQDVVRDEKNPGRIFTNPGSITYFEVFSQAALMQLILQFFYQIQQAAFWKVHQQVLEQIFWKLMKFWLYSLSLLAEQAVWKANLAGSG